MESFDGDILFLHMSNDPIRAGESGRDIPIVHRVIKVHERESTGEIVVTITLTMIEFSMLKVSFGFIDIIKPKAVVSHKWFYLCACFSFLPYVGWVTIIMTEKPIIKYLLIAALGILVITSMG
ncbi:hypothetical protein HID58_028410 [Brassica napus]|uniref:Signal peptidase complex catalytic subunit SEC11 n=1 Tax=Brassica napus TaxID=3708 RepID=A0ABQ8CA60_BRANA|nr:hypothetical protein HID58_028410 [Brassica napus]